jgi:hypothetical protein
MAIVREDSEDNASSGARSGTTTVATSSGGSITRLVNGVVCTIAPAVLANTGPSNQSIEFTSKVGTTLSLPISITFNKPISEFSIVAVGLSNGSHVSRAYGPANHLLDTVVTSTNNPDSGAGGGIETITLKGNDILKVVLEPFQDYVGYRNIVVIPAADAPEVPASITVPTPPTFIPPVLKKINLGDIISIDTLNIDRQYVRGTLRNIPSQQIVVTNDSDDIEVQIEFSPLAGLTFDPVSFSLHGKEKKEVIVSFDSTAIDVLPEGINTFNIAINYTSNTIPMTPFPEVIQQPPVIIPINNTTPVIVVPAAPTSPSPNSEPSPTTGAGHDGVKFK